ncbi:peptidoglycan-binding protein [Streptomyces sp. NPDC052687]|uniref:peptidoglycan-binding protein n=1 Tax=Streptomyces sp. NPDC052687 TaxID=3154759 RepID=UPI00343A5997
METPVFAELDPPRDCDCPGCVTARRALPPPPGGRSLTPRAVAVTAATAAALAAAPTPAPALAAPHAPQHPGVPAGDEPETPQGSKAPLHGPAGKPATPNLPAKAPATTRAEIIRRAKTWVAARVPYSMTRYWSDGYRQDCSGFVSMAWGLPGNEWTGTLHQYGVRIGKDELQPGDILLFHNPADPERGSHVVIFGGWTDYTRSFYIAYESTRPHARGQATPYAYWTNSDRYVAYRYKGLKASGTPGAQPGGAAGGGGGVGGGGGGGPVATPFPGVAYFGPGANNPYVTLLGRMLVQRGAGRFYTSGPGPRWTEADRRATQAFQLAQGWTGAAADGLPGPKTWDLLISGRGRNVTAGTAGASGAQTGRVPAFPGRAMFRPGARNEYVTLLGRQLVKKGFGRHYTTGPGPLWGEADRRNVEAFQRAQGWRGGAADGYPGPETWRRLFS